MFDVERDDDEWCEVYTLGDFKDMIRNGAFIPSDGSGYLGTETHFAYEFSIWGMLERMEKRPEGATHVHWFNK